MDTTYAVSAAAWSALGYVLGFVTHIIAPRIRRSERGGNRMAGPLRHRLLVMTVVLVTLVSAAQLAWFSYQQRRTTSCQADYNQAFIQALRVRASIADSDRESLAVMVRAITEAKSGEESRKALDDYLATKARNDAERSQAPLPEDKFPTDHC